MSIISEFWFYNFIVANKISFSRPTLFFSVFYKYPEIIRFLPGLKIFFTGENTDDSSVIVKNKFYKNDCVDFCDLSIGFRIDVDNNNYFRLPLWHINFIRPHWNLEQIRNWINTIENNKSIVDYKGRKFCSMVASHDLSGVRRKILDCLSEFGEIDCAGKFANNTNVLKKAFNNNKIAYIQNFKFNICAENSNFSGYVTEKLFDSLIAGCLPIYWGGEGVAEELILNQDRILYYGSNDFQEKLSKLCERESELIKFYKQNIFTENAADIIYQRQKELKDRFLKLSNQ
jgi:hypothetical protein